MIYFLSMLINLSITTQWHYSISAASKRLHDANDWTRKKMIKEKPVSLCSGKKYVAPTKWLELSDMTSMHFLFLFIKDILLSRGCQKAAVGTIHIYICIFCSSSSIPRARQFFFFFLSINSRYHRNVRSQFRFFSSDVRKAKVGGIGVYICRWGDAGHVGTKLCAQPLARV